MRSACLFLLVCGTTFADEKPADPTAELKKLEGNWAILTIGQEGFTIRLDNATWTFTGDKYSFKAGDQAQEGTVTLDPSADPKQIDLAVTGGNGKGEKYRGIYKLADGKLVMCFPNAVKKDRPKEFTSPEGSGRLVYTLERKPK